MATILFGRKRLVIGNQFLNTPFKFTVGPFFNAGTTSIIIDSSDFMYIGGGFTQQNGLPCGYLTRLNPNYSQDLSYDTSTGFDNIVYSMFLDSSDKLFVGGMYANYRGSTQPRLIKLNYDSTKDATFDIGTGFDIPSYPDFGIQTILVDSNKKIYAGGTFNNFRSSPQKNIVRINSDGTKDTMFNASTNNTVYSIVKDLNDRVYIGGTFSQYNGSTGTRRYLVRVTSTGAIDNTFNIPEQGLIGGPGDAGNSQDPGLRAIAIDSSNRVYVGGDILGIGGFLSSHFIKLSSDGMSQIILADVSFNGRVKFVTEDTSGKIYIGGMFTTYNGIAQNRLIRLNSDGTKDTFFDVSNGFNSDIYGVTFDSNKKVYVYGRFTTYKGLAYKYLVRLNDDATVDTSFDVSTYFNEAIYKSIIEPGTNKVIAAGYFTTYRAVGQGKIVKINTDTTTDATFTAAGASGGSFPSIYDMIYDSSQLYIGGNFTTWNAASISGIVRINALTGATDSSFNVGVGMSANAYVYTLKKDTSNNIFAGGSFTTYKGASIKQLIKIDPSGNRDLTFDTSNGFGSDVYSIEFAPNNKLWVGGFYTTYRGYVQNRFCRLNVDGALDSTYIRNGANAAVQCISNSSTGLLIGGDFDYIGYYPKKGLIRLNSDGSYDASFNSGGIGFNIATGNPSPLIVFLKIDASNNVLVGGNFTSYNQGIYDVSTTKRNFIKLNNDGTINSTFNQDPSGFNYYVNSVITKSNANYVMAGSFSQYKTYAQSNIMALNQFGALDPSFSLSREFSSGSSVRSITIAPDSKIYASGDFTTLDNIYTRGLVRFTPGTGARDTNFSVGDGFSNVVFRVKNDVINPSKIYVCGYFGAFNSDASICNIVKLNDDGSRDMSFNPAGGTGPWVSGNYVWTKDIQFDASGKLFMCGNFYKYQGLPVPSILKLNADGSRDYSFYTGLVDPGGLECMLVDQSTNKIYIGGTFSTWGGQWSPGVTRVDLSTNEKDVTFDVSMGIYGNSWVSSQLDVQSGAIDPSTGKIYVVGNYILWNGISKNRLVRLNPNGSVDASFNIGTGFNAYVYSVAVDKLGKVYCGGDFTTYQGVTSNYLIRLNDDGSKDASFNQGTGLNAQRVSALAVDASNRIVVGGGFKTYNGYGQKFLIRILNDGTRDTTFDVSIGSTNSTVFAILIDPSDGSMFIGGNFTVVSGVTKNYLCKITSTGAIDNSFAIGSGIGGQISYNNFAFDASKNFFFGTNTPYRYLPNGAVDPAWTAQTVPSGTIRTIAVDQYGKVHIGGDFQGQYNGNLYSYYTRLTKNGLVDSTLARNGGVSLYCTKIICTSTQLYQFGDFSAANSYKSSSIVRLNSDGSLDPTFVPSPVNYQGYTQWIEKCPDGKIMASGNFTTPGTYMVKYNDNGTVDSSFVNAGFNTAPLKFRVHPITGDIYVLGTMTSYGGQMVKSIARLNSGGVLDRSFMPYLTATVYWCEFDWINNKILVGTASSQGGIIRLNYNGTKN